MCGKGNEQWPKNKAEITSLLNENTSRIFACERRCRASSTDILGQDRDTDYDLKAKLIEVNIAGESRALTGGDE